MHVCHSLNLGVENELIATFDYFCISCCLAGISVFYRKETWDAFATPIFLSTSTSTSFLLSLIKMHVSYNCSIADDNNFFINFQGSKIGILRQENCICLNAFSFLKKKQDNISNCFDLGIIK